MSNRPRLSLHDPGIPLTRGPLMQFADDPIACMRRLNSEHGDLAVLEENDQRLVFVFSPDLNREVLSNSQVYESRFFAVRGNRNSAQRRVTSGLLSQNGAEHRDARRMMKDVFSKKILPDYHPTICQLASELTDSWTIGKSVDLNSEMVQFMLKMTAALLFGVDDAEFAYRLGALIDRWVHRNHEIGMGALVSSPTFARGYDDLLVQAEELEQSVQEMFQTHRGTQHNRLNILSLLFEAQKSQEQLTDNKLIGHATLLFAAAHLTTAHTFSWTLFLLSQHPEVLRKLQAELIRNVSGDVPGLEELDRLPYLDAVIKESMRVLPASSYSQRVAVEPTSLGPVRMNPGTPVIFSQYITHHRADLFEDPDRFIPERWATITPSPYEYLPFGAGPRMCIGAPLAMAEIRTALTVMLKRFNFQIKPMSTVNGHVISTMLGPTSTIPATLLPHDQLPQSTPVAGSIHNLIRLPDAVREIPVPIAA
ncbi:MAG: cytochrome P450 [Planctomycetaceae bacterium]|nr:cytochrome P450 [Planctomycetaceae bacterium]